MQKIKIVEHKNGLKKCGDAFSTFETKQYKSLDISLEREYLKIRVERRDPLGHSNV